MYLKQCKYNSVHVCVCVYVHSTLHRRSKKILQLLLRKKLKIIHRPWKKEEPLKKYFSFEKKCTIDLSIQRKLPLSFREVPPPLLSSTFPRGLSLIRSLAKTGPGSMKNPPFLERVRHACPATLITRFTQQRMSACAHLFAYVCVFTGSWVH